MAAKRMSIVVLAATALFVVEEITHHEAERRYVEPIDPVFLNFTTTTEAFDIKTNRFKPGWYIAANNTLVKEQKNSAALSIDAPDEQPGEKPDEEPPKKPKQSFYLKRLPKSMLMHALLVPLRQCWNILLERWFPARSSRSSRSSSARRQANPAAAGSKDVVEKMALLAGEDNAEWEQQVVNRLVAEGKVRRSSIGFWNTLFKWLLDLTVGKILYEIVYHAIATVLLDHAPSKIVANIEHDGLMCFISSFFSTGPLFLLIGFIVIPAQYRVIFESAGDLCWALFFNTFCLSVFPKMLSTKIVRTSLDAQTSEMWKQARLHEWLQLHAKDEL